MQSFVKIFLLTSSLFCFGKFSFSQNYDWIIPNKIYLKTYVASEGMIRIDRTDFTNAGINTSVIDPRTIKVYNNGLQIPVYFRGQQDGVFNENDFFDFFAKRNYGGLTNTYDQNNSVAYVTDEFFNLYSDTNTYWIGWDGAAGIRYDSSTFVSGENYPQGYFTEKIHFEYDKIYSLGENANSSDFRFLSNEKFKGEGWYWKLLSNGQSVNDTFSLPDLHSVPQNASIKLFAYPKNNSTTILNEHRIDIRINGIVASTVFSNDFNKIDTIVNFSSSLLNSGSVNNIEIVYTSETGFSGFLYFDCFELSYPKNFNIRSNKLSWNITDSDTTSCKFSISGYNSLNPLFIYDVKNNLRLLNHSISGDIITVTAKKNSKIEIINNSIVSKPFRIKQKSVPDYLSGTNGADYLLVYNKLFENQAEQLRTFRESNDNFRSVKAEIEDIYDIFNFGQENPIAIKRFVRYIYDNWQMPKLQYICLFGRSSLDPKKNVSTSAYYNNFVPTYGNPNSDGYFAHLNTGGFYYSTDIGIGRIPVYQISEAQAVVDKIIAYESQSPDLWWKNFSFITGGGTYSEQQSHQTRSNYEINTFVTPPSVSGNGIKIYRTDTSGVLTYNIADSVKNVFNRGTLFVNFRGHAGSHDWEVIMNDPNTLSNGSKLPIILSLTCFTGENAKSDFRGFGERMLYLGNKGAIGFISTTGWSFSNSGNDLGTFIIQNIKRDTARRTGEFMTEAGFRMRTDSGSFNVRHTINCYSLIGDPASKLVLPEHPEFQITQSDYKLSNETPLKNEPVTLTIFPKNFGLYADTCRIRFQLKKNNQNYSFKDTIYRAFKFLDTVKHNFTLDSSGIYDMVVTLDINNRYPFEDETNNSITINIPTKENTFIVLKPIDNSVVHTDSIIFSGLNPNFSYGTSNVKTILRLDTTRNFNSPVFRTFINNNAGTPVTSFKTLLPVLINNTMYYWTSASIVNNDTTGWSRIQSFIYNNGSESGDDPQMRFINSVQNVQLRKFRSEQYSETDLNNTSLFGNSIKISEKLTRLFVRSYGSNAEEASYFSVGSQNIFIDAGLNFGLNMLKVSRLTGKVYQFRNFRVNNSASSDSIVAFLNTFDTTHYLMLLNAPFDPQSSILTSAAKNKLRQFGSVYCDSIHLVGYFHTWSFIGFLGASHSETSEMFDPCCRTSPTCTACDHWAQSISQKDVYFRQPEGTVTYFVGPASEWMDFTWTQTLSNSGRISFDVFGIDPNNNVTQIYSGLQNNVFTDISQINSLQYPRLKLVAKLEIDTLLGFESPSLNSIKINYSPAYELVLDANSFQITSAEKNQSSVFSFNYLNPGYSYIYGNIVNVFQITGNDSLLLYTDTAKNTIESDSIKIYTGNMNIPSLPENSRISFTIKSKDGKNEFYYYNNFAELNQSATGNSIQIPVVELYYNGKRISSGENVNSNPELKLRFPSGSINLLSHDTSAVILLLNKSVIPYSDRVLNYKKFTRDQYIGKESIGYNELTFYPDLKNGNNVLSVLIKTGSEDYDTLNFDLNVNDEYAISDLYNYPNPMKNETDFIFIVSGKDNPGLMKIKIYTVSGKLIRQIDHFAAGGINVIKWDGRDNDGDYTANGTYLYKLISEDKDFKETQIQKLVILK